MDRRDFEGWYVEYHPRLVTVLVATVGDREVAVDAADEALARALEKWNTVSKMESPDGWTYKVGLNFARKRLRRANLERRLRRKLEQPRVVEGPTGEIWSLVADLGPRQREAVALRHIGGLSEPEIAKVMGITRGTVNSTLRAAHKHLRDALTPTAAGIGTRGNAKDA